MYLGANNESSIPTLLYNPDVSTATTYVRLASSADAIVAGTDAANGTALSASTSGASTQVAVNARATNSNGEGIAVRAQAGNGIALYGQASSSGYGLQVVGRAVFNRSGRVQIIAGQLGKTVTGFSVTPATLVVATIQGYVADTWVSGVQLDDPNDRFTIRLNKAAPTNLWVGYFIVN